MAGYISYDGLQCPQYVNFSAGFEEVPNDVTEFGLFNSPAVKDPFKFKVPQPKKDVNVTSTLKKKPVLKVVQSSNVTDSVKLNAKKMLSKRFSKSDGDLNIEPSGKRTVKKKVNYFGGHKRSLSENDLRIKKKILPTTPMCLKRTINNMKAKKLMTTEERELEIIAKLRKQTFQHLRANEITMKRQKMKQACNSQKESGISTIKDKKAPVKNLQQDNSILAKIKDYTKNARIQAQKQGTTKETSSLHAETLKKIANLKKNHSASSNRFENFLPNPIASDGVSVTTFEKESISAVMKTLPLKKIDAHSGVLFSVSQKKTAIKPFNFQDRINDLNLSSKSESGLKQKVPMNNILKTPKLIAKNKENISTQDVTCSSVKSGRQQMGKKTEFRGFRY